MKLKFLVISLLFTALCIGCTSEDNNAGEPPVLSPEKSIETFIFKADLNTGLAATIEATIDQNNKEITVAFPVNTVVINLRPTIVMFSENATVSPNSEEAVDFTNSVTYTVTAEDGAIQEYTVKSEVATQTNITATTITTDTNKNLDKIHFVNETTGYIVGGDTEINSDNDTAIILKTTDGGRTWNTVYTNTGFYTLSVYATSATTAYVTTSSNIILKTTDGGVNWQEIEVATNRFFMADIKFTDNNTGYIAGSNGANGRLYMTSDAGETWMNLATNNAVLDNLLISNQLNSIDFPTASTILISGGAWNNGTLLKSTDSGVNWEKQHISANIKTTDVNLIGNTGFLTGNNGITSVGSELGELFKTINNGENWSKIETGYTNRMERLSYKNEVICVVGRNESNDFTNPEFIILSRDNGDTWAKVEHDFIVVNWNDIQFISNDKLIAVGHSGKAILIQL